MALYEFKDLEKKWQQFWQQNKTFEAPIDTQKPKYYVLDMFPYPSGAGLHVGHPLGYIASDIMARYKRLKGFNVLHPMGFDAFGLPAEQYAIQTGQHPAVTTETNIKRYKEQLKNIGFAYDWDKEVQTCDPEYYKWTQWIFMQLFDSWYNNETDKAEPIEELKAAFSKNGSASVSAACEEDSSVFTAEEWGAYSENEQEDILQQYRLAYLANTTVNWCAELGTVLSNDEVKDGFSERGGYPVVRKDMMQWNMRITAYSDRLLRGLDDLDWSDAVKEMQRNWIGKSLGAEVSFSIDGHEEQIKVFTTRMDTIYGVSFVVLAPESELVEQITTKEQKEAVEAYVEVAKNRSERERQAEVDNITGVFTGAYVQHPFEDKKIPVWVADYVLAGYGTGAVMAVPSGDQRDYDFAKKFDLPIIQIIDQQNIEEAADPTKEGKMIQSGFMNGLSPLEAIEAGIKKIELMGIGRGKVNFRLRDAIFGRQRYWGEPFPVYFENGIPKLVEEKDMPVELPDVDKYLPTEAGDPPLGRAEGWNYKGQSYELSTMPGWAGSSWYFFRYMDAHNKTAIVGEKEQAYWENVDLYIGGTEHATGHLIYSRFWTKFLYDRGHVTADEPFKKMINQGMIQGRSNFVYRVKGSNQFVSFGLRKEYDCAPMHVDVNIVHQDVLDTEKFKSWRPDLKEAEFVLEDGKYLCGTEVEKMSKSKFNVVSPDDIIERFGADTLRLYEMFLGPLEQSKPWNTNGIDGVYKFLKKLWALFYDQEGNLILNDEEATKEELMSLHKCIKKATEDLDRFSFNTSVSNFMICVNELTQQKCHKKAILKELVVVVAPYAPHIAEELWSVMGNNTTVFDAQYPLFDPAILTVSEHEYPVMINGKMRAKLKFSLSESNETIEKAVIENEVVQKWLEGKPPKRIIIVPKKIINVVK